MAKLAIPRPWCKKCLKPVEHLEVHGPTTDRFAYKIIVHCHGKRDSCLISLQALVNANAIHPGYAFE